MSQAPEGPIQIRKMRLISCEFRAEHQTEVDEQSSNVNIQLKFHQETDTEGVLVLELLVGHENDSSPFKASVVYEAMMEQDGSVDTDMFRRVCLISVGSIIVSYVRPLLHRVSTEAGTPFHLPLLDLREVATPDADSGSY